MLINEENSYSESSSGDLNLKKISQIFGKMQK